MTEIPSNQTKETVLREFAKTNLGFNETSEMLNLRDLVVSAETDDQYIDSLGNYQRLGEIEVNKSGDNRSRANIGMTLVVAGIKYSRGDKDTYAKEAMEDAFVDAMNEGFGDIQDKITEIEPSINRNDFDFDKYYRERKY